MQMSKHDRCRCHNTRCKFGKGTKSSADMQMIQGGLRPPHRWSVQCSPQWLRTPQPPQDPANRVIFLLATMTDSVQYPESRLIFLLATMMDLLQYPANRVIFPLAMMTDLVQYPANTMIFLSANSSEGNSQICYQNSPKRYSNAV